jgi:hypothetical protein
MFQRISRTKNMMKISQIAKSFVFKIWSKISESNLRKKCWINYDHREKKKRKTSRSTKKSITSNIQSNIFTHVLVLCSRTCLQICLSLILRISRQNLSQTRSWLKSFVKLWKMRLKTKSEKKIIIKSWLKISRSFYFWIKNQSTISRKRISLLLVTFFIITRTSSNHELLKTRSDLRRI